MRTAGSMEPYADLGSRIILIKAAFRDEDASDGAVSSRARFLSASTAHAHRAGRRSPARQLLGRRGFYVVQAYQLITRAELGQQSSSPCTRLKITGHLCSVTFREAADLGIDNLEHGLGTDTEFYKDKQPDPVPRFRSPDRVPSIPTSMALKSAPQSNT